MIDYTAMEARPELEHTLIQSYVCNKYFISTVYRRSSAELAPGWYYETIMWAWDKATKKRGKLIQIEDSGGLPDTALESHLAVCRAALAAKEGGE